MKQSRNKIGVQEEVDFILNNLSQADRNEFLTQLTASVLLGGDNINIVFSWKETAEINANPTRKNRLQLRRAKLIRLVGKKNA